MSLNTEPICRTCGGILYALQDHLCRPYTPVIIHGTPAPGSIGGDLADAQARIRVLELQNRDLEDKVTRMDGLLLEWTSLIEFASNDKPGKDLEARTRKEINFKGAESEVGEPELCGSLGPGELRCIREKGHDGMCATNQSR